MLKLEIPTNNANQIINCRTLENALSFINQYGIKQFYIDGEYNIIIDGGNNDEQTIIEP